MPAIDIIAGRCVRLTQGDYARTCIYNNNPLVIAKKFKKLGARILHIIDLDGAKIGSPCNLNLVKKIKSATGASIQLGGGIRDYAAAKKILSFGIEKIIIGTMAIERASILKKLLSEFGPERIVVAVDIRNNQPMTRGWLTTGKISLTKYLERISNLGIKYLLVTDIERDGTLAGPNIPLTKKIVKLEFKTIVAGGIKSAADLDKLQSAGAYGVILGKSLYEKTINLPNVLRAHQNNGNLAKRIIPCLDIKNGRVVKGVGFKKLKDAGDPVEMARLYCRQGADELVLLDISATNEKRRTMIELVNKVALAINVPFTVGGGINTIRDIDKLLDAGADKVALCTAAANNLALVRAIARRFGSQCLVISIDAKKQGNHWRVCTNGGTKITNIDAVEFACLMEKNGAGELLVNSLDRDGTGQGFDVELLDQIASAVNIPIIASSGAGSMKDFLAAFRSSKIDAVLAASIFHYNRATIPKIKKYLCRQGLPIRL